MTVRVPDRRADAGVGVILVRIGVAGDDVRGGVLLIPRHQQAHPVGARVTKRGARRSAGGGIVFVEPPGDVDDPVVLEAALTLSERAREQISAGGHDRNGRQQTYQYRER